MKKKYVSPEIKLIEMETVNLMTLSHANVDSFDGKSDNDTDSNEDIGTWGGEEGDYEF